ncbi:helix-turn-helix domain-containing protein [Kribbella sp. CA-294648]|uniref:helix-turn-helix domain-containing protein n=1 Tax=Kribbella sp. CA-294648 TaxID=3239948 RepID=UPI003D8A530C
MYDRRVRRLAVEALAAGETLSAVSRRLGVSRATLRDWLKRPDPKLRPTECPRCAEGQLPSADYAHLLGLYLGDGCLSALKKGVYSLRIACDDRYPRLIDEAAGAIEAIHPNRPVHRVQAVGYTAVVSYWKHWPCLFPQHGPGPKHLRRIELDGWQRELIVAEPGLFLRGLFNSDGCRVANWTARRVGGELKRYEYPRCQFSNESADIMALCQWALDLVGIPWRMPRRNALSVARREAVAALDLCVGPKS